MKWWNARKEWTHIPKEDRLYNWARLMCRLKPDGTGKPAVHARKHPSRSKTARKSRARNR